MPAKLPMWGRPLIDFSIKNEQNVTNKAAYFIKHAS